MLSLESLIYLESLCPGRLSSTFPPPASIDSGIVMRKNIWQTVFENVKISPCGSQPRRLQLACFPWAGIVGRLPAAEPGLGDSTTAGSQARPISFGVCHLLGCSFACIHLRLVIVICANLGAEERLLSHLSLKFFSWYSFHACFSTSYDMGLSLRLEFSS